jgi:hypothetical protein
MSDVISIKQLEDELNLNATSLAAHMIEYTLHWMVCEMQMGIWDKQCTLHTYSRYRWELVCNHFRIRLQLYPEKNRVRIWNKGDMSMWLFSSANPAEIVHCVQTLMDLIIVKRLSTLAYQ